MDNNNQTPENFTQFVIGIFRKSYFGILIIMVIAFSIAVLFVFNVLPEKTKQDVIDNIVSHTPEQQQNDSDTKNKIGENNPTRAPEPISKPSKKYIKVKLIVNAKYSNAKIFANEKEISPYEDSTIIKLLEIEYENRDIELVVQIPDSSKKCTKHISIPKNYFQTLKFIEVICSN